MAKGKTAHGLVVKKKSELAVKGISSAEVAVLRDSLGKGLTDPEFKVWLMVCKKYGADPIMKDIVPIAFNGKDGRTLGFIQTRNFLLKKAQSSKKNDFEALQSGMKRDPKSNAIVSGWAKLWKKGSEREFSVEVDFKEYFNEKNDIWKKFPGAMIRKVAESIVLRQAYSPDMPSEEEMEKEITGIENMKLPPPGKTKFSISDSGKVHTEAVEAEVVEKPGKAADSKKKGETIKL